MHQSSLISLPRKSGHVTYGDNNKGKILGVGKIGTNSSSSIENVLLVEGLKHSLLSVSQLCDKGYLVLTLTTVLLKTSMIEI